MNKKHILIVGIGFFLMATIYFMEYNQSPSNSFNINLGKDGDNDVLGENYLKIAATANYTLDFDTTWGGGNYDYANGITVDGAGNIYITGYTTSFGGGGCDAFIAKYDSAGTSLLNITWGGSNSDYANDIALDGAGNIYITGCTNSFGVGYDVFVAKYDSAGTSLLNITWGGSNGESGNGITVDGAGNIYITGDTYSFGAGFSDAFIAKYDSAGTSLLNITWGGSDYEFTNGITVDGAGNIYITGLTRSFGAGYDDAFIAKYDSAGTPLLNIIWGGNVSDSGNGIALDGAGNIYITGYTNMWGMQGTEDAFIAKYDSTGTSLLNITWDGSNGDSGYGIALDGAGNIYITGYTNMYGTGGPDAFIAKYDSTGTSLLNITWGGSNYDSGNGIALDGAGNIYITGRTHSFGAGFSDAFIAKYNLTIDDSTDAGIPGPTILLIGIISALSIGMILKRLLQTNKLRRI